MCSRQNNVVYEFCILLFETYVHLNKLHAISDIECDCLRGFLSFKKMQRKRDYGWLFEQAAML